MTSDDVIKFIALTVIVFLPVLTVTVAIAARFAVKPLAEAILQIRNAFNANQPKVLQTDEIKMLQQDISDLRHTVEQLRDIVEFERALTSPSARALQSENQPRDER